MQNQPLLLSSLLQHADRFHGSTEIVSRTVEGPIHRYGYKDAARRTRKLADALRRWGVGPGDRVATLAWNNYRHFEIEHGVTGLGAVWHAINPRLIAAQISYIANHAEDRVLFLKLFSADGGEARAGACQRPPLRPDGGPDGDAGDEHPEYPVL
jgi:fatty-acyl-CoA synthase